MKRSAQHSWFKSDRKGVALKSIYIIPVLSRMATERPKIHGESPSQTHDLALDIAVNNYK